MASTAAGSDTGSSTGMELLGRKLGMTQIFTEQGERVPVTVLSIGPCVVVQKKSEESDGYTAVQLGFEDQREKHTTQARKGHFAKSGTSPKRFLFEVRLPADQAEAFELGQALDCASTFQDVERVDVAGLTKGRGFTGVIKRWNFGMPKQTHGTHEYFRHGGSMGAGSYPGRISKGRKMAGRFGGERVTQLGLRVERIEPEQNLMYVRGAVPGHTNGLVRVRTSNRG